MSKSEFARDLMGSSRFVISRTTVAPKATQSDPELPQVEPRLIAPPGEIVLPKHMITWLRMTYECPGTSLRIGPLLGSAGWANKSSLELIPAMPCW
jgi:hypothetical protein